MTFRSLSSKLISMSFVLLTSTAFAHCYKGEVRNYKCEIAPCVPCCECLHDGLYVGGGLGYDNFRVRDTFSLRFGQEDRITDTTTLSGNPPIAVNGWAERLFLGYGKYFNDYYLGAEVFISNSDADASFNINKNSNTFINYAAKIEADTGYGISILPGLKLNQDTMAYLRFGYNWVSLTTKESLQEIQLSPFDSNHSSYVHGFSYGIGAETYLACNWSLRSEYTHTNYSSFKGISRFVDHGEGVFDTYYSRFSPSDNQYMVDLVYHIA